MSEVLNIDRVHRNGKAELEVGLRGNGFIIKRDETTGELIILDLKNNYSLNISNIATKDEIINNLHYYSSKDIAYNESLFSIYGSVLSIDCTTVSDGTLVIPYNLEPYNILEVTKPENITKIIIPRGMDLINNGEIMTDDDLLAIFPNIKISVRVHSDGAVLSYNYETLELN